MITRHGFEEFHLSIVPSEDGEVYYITSRALKEGKWAKLESAMLEEAEKETPLVAWIVEQQLEQLGLGKETI